MRLMTCLSSIAPEMRDAHRSSWRQGPLPLLYLLLQIALHSEAIASGMPGQVSSTDIRQSVVSSLPHSQGQAAHVIAKLDLTRPFETRTQWTFVAAILPGSHFDGASAQPVNGGALAQCFVDQLASHCKYKKPKNDFGWFSTPIELYVARVVYAGADNTDPFLLIKTGSAHGGDGSHAICTELFAYERLSNRFRSVFANGTGSNNNQETRFIEEGPLRGDVIVAEPTSSAPFGYWISVYARNTKDGVYTAQGRGLPTQAPI